MNSDGPKHISKSALAFLSGTSLSRLTGLLRDLSMAFCFGSAPAIAAFMVAFRFSHLMRRLFGEGALSSGIIPHFESLRGEKPKEGALFFSSLLRSVAVFSTGVIILAEVALYFFLQSAGPDSKEVILFTMWMLPGTLFICLFGSASALLQCEKRFFLFGAAPAAFNLVWIAAVWFLKDKNPAEAAYGLAIAIVLALAMQCLIILPRTFAILRQFLSWKECLTGPIFSSELRAVLKPFFLGILGVGAVQINSALDALFARYASLEGPAYLWYAIRMQQLPLALFGIALSSALLPSLSRAIRAQDFPLFKQLLQFSLKRSFSIMFPCSVAIFVLGLSSVNLLYGRGDFSTDATMQTTYCLWGYGIGLVPAVFVLLLAPAFYAQKDYKTPMKATLFSVALNIVLNAALVFFFHLGAFSIAVSTSVCSLLSCLYLMHYLKPFIDFSILRSFIRTMACSCIAGGGTLVLGYFLVQDPTLPMIGQQGMSLISRAFSAQTVNFFALTGSFIFLFFSYAWLLNVEEVLELVGLKKKTNVPTQETSG